jgi:7-keto-8-aminopelargonate synthetase-like enzyme
VQPAPGAELRPCALQVIDFLRRYSPAHVYASSMSPAAVQQVTSALQLLLGQDGTDRGRRKIRQLHDNANYVRCAQGAAPPCLPDAVMLRSAWPSRHIAPSLPVASAHGR